MRETYQFNRGKQQRSLIGLSSNFTLSDATSPIVVRGSLRNYDADTEDSVDQKNKFTFYLRISWYLVIYFVYYCQNYLKTDLGHRDKFEIIIIMASRTKIYEVFPRCRRLQARSWLTRPMRERQGRKQCLQGNVMSDVVVEAARTFLLYLLSLSEFLLSASNWTTT